MPDEPKTIAEEGGLPPNWVPKDTAPIIPGAPPASQQQGPGAFFSGPLSSNLQHDAAFYQTKYGGAGSPEFPLMPLAPSGNPSNNAAIQSIVEESVSTAVANSTTPPAKPCIGVNYHTEQYYTVQLTDLNDLLSFNNNAGGVITLPGGPVGGFGFVQAVYGGGEGPGASVAITNTPTNGMIAVVFTSPNVTLGTVSVADTSGNIWIPITTNQASSELMATFYCAKVAGGTNSVVATVPFTPPTPPPDQIPFFTFISVYEFSGMLPNGLDQFGNGLGTGSAFVSPTKSSTFAFTVAQATAASAGQNPTAGSGWTAASPPQTNISWNYPAYLGSGPGGFMTGIGEYISNPTVGVSLAATATGGAEADCNFTIANFQVGPNTPATGFTKCFYTFIENTGTGTFVLESAAQIDGANQSVSIGPNEGLLVVFDGTNWATMRGIGGGGSGSVVTSLNLLTGGILLTAGTGITVNTSPGTIQISATAVGETAQTLWSWPAISSAQNTMNPVNSGSMNFSANQVKFMYLHIDVPLQVGNFTFNPDTGDAVHHYDWGMYSLSGALIWNLGATIFSGTGLTTTPLVQGTITIQPGDYWLAFTGDGTGITFFALTPTARADYYFFLNSVSGTPVWWTSITTSTGGTLTGLNPTVPAAPTTAGNLSNQNTVGTSSNSFPVIALST